MGIAYLVLLAIVALVVAGFLAYGMLLGIIRLVRLLLRAYVWFATPEEEQPRQ